MQLGQQQLELSTDGRAYVFAHNSPLHLAQATTVHHAIVGDAAASEEEKQAFKKQAGSQTEQLLWLAYKLQLVPLQHRLRSFMRGQTQFPASIFGTPALVHTMFSERVLDAALGPSASQAVCEAWIKSELLQPCDLVDGPCTQQLLLPIDLTEQQTRPTGPLS